MEQPPIEPPKPPRPELTPQQRVLKSQYEKRLNLYKDVSLLNRGMLISTEDKKADSDAAEILLREVVFDNPEVVIEINDEDSEMF